MKLDNLRIEQGNWFAQQGLIPLGINTFKGNRDNRNPIISVRYKQNGSIVIIATSGWGKSVLVRRINEYIIYIFGNNKACLIIDTQGVDHRLMRFKNDRPHPLWYKKGEQPFAFENVINYTPIFASNKSYPEDIVFGITLNDLTPKDFLSSGMSVGSKDEILKIKFLSENNRRIMDDPTMFYQQFSNLPSKGSSNTRSKIDYPTETLVQYSIKQSLERYFSVWQGYNPDISEKPIWMSKARWETEKIPPYFVSAQSKYYKPTFWSEFDKKQIIVANFMDVKEQPIAMAMYGGYLLKDAYKYCEFNKKLNKDFPGLFVFVEECNLFIDAEDKYLEKGSNFYLTEILCRGFKFEMSVVASFQSVTGSNPQVREYLTSGSNPVIIGNLTKNDREYLSKIFPGIKDLELREEIPGLKWGAKEWVVYYNDREYDTFVPYPCMSMYHKRGK